MAQPQPIVGGVPEEQVGRVSDIILEEYNTALRRINERILHELRKEFTHDELFPILANEIPSLAYCTECEELHRPGLAIPVDDSTGRACQASTFKFTNPHIPYPPSYHPLILHALKQAHDAGRDTADLEELLQTNTTSDFSGEHPCHKDWSHSVNEHGVFVALEQRIPPSSYPTEFSLDVCEHNQFKFTAGPRPNGDVTVECSRNSGPFDEVVRNTNKIAGCHDCHCDYRIQLKEQGMEGFEFLVVVVTTWVNLGDGRNSREIGICQEDATWRRSNRLYTGQIAELSGLLP